MTLALSGVAPLLAAMIISHAGIVAAQERCEADRRNAWVRATPQGAQVTAAYLQFKGGAERGDRLLAVKVDAAIAGIVEIHDMYEEGGVYKMRRLDGIEVKSNAAVDSVPVDGTSC